MLGFYENFPPYAHRVERFAIAVSNRKFQQMLVQTLYKINGKVFKFEEVAKPPISNCSVIFEFGVADGDGFNYLDLEELNRVMEVVRKKPLQIMDFFCAVRYYSEKNGKKTHLKFDYYMIRLIFSESRVEFYTFHERGLGHLLPEDIINLIVARVNEVSSRKVLKRIE